MNATYDYESESANFAQPARPTVITVIVVLSIVRALIMSWVWLVLPKDMDRFYYFDEGVRLAYNILLYGLPIEIILTTVMSLGLWRLREWARKGMIALYALSTGLAVLTIFRTGPQFLTLLQLGLGVLFIVLLSRQETRVAFRSNANDDIYDYASILDR